ncbi:MAG: alpha-1,2-fucosyltransferase [Sideroxyarcus sp.]|nr:alpha-1,2-fucosyltransferase [Sideroxyarcus sp.]
MVISKVIGGLGNQMFQYAAGRAASLAQGVPLRLDISGFTNYGLHQGFELNRVFNCLADIACEGDVRRILGWQYLPIVREKLARPSLSICRGKGYVIEPHFHYWQGIESIPKECYLVGYWQSEKYFQNEAAAIHADFTFKLPLSGPNKELADKISLENAVSLHVRRGDYANNPITTATHGLCSIEYYQAAISHIAEKVESPHFYIFSDDVNWVKENLKINFPCHYVGHNQGAESYNDMRLMSLCRHHIIANSSFSWWGAWLNRNPNKIVVAPKKWFANTNSTRDLFPQGWVTL